MSIKTRLRKLEQISAFEPPRCDCPFPTTHYELANGTVYPPVPPCLRGQCPEAGKVGKGPPPVRMITLGCSVRPADGPAPGWTIKVDDFRLWDPETDRPRLRIIVWRDAETGRLRYHGPPRWWEIEGIEEPRVVRGVGVPERLEAIVAELRETDETRGVAAQSCEGLQ